MLKQNAQNWFSVQKMKAFYCIVDDCEFEDGAKALLQASGIGKLKPNILMMGFKTDWQTCDAKNLHQYFNVLQ